MNAGEEHLYTQYFYDSVIEFIYFIILYAESYGYVGLDTISKHVIFFKTEVSVFISSFAGNTLEEKLSRMLNVLKCFILSENKITNNRKYQWKHAIFEDLIIHMTVDLVLKGVTSVGDILKKLNFNNVIFIEKENFLNILKKSSHFSVRSDSSITLHHIHGILGLEEFAHNSVIIYFQNILLDSRELSYDEIEYHSKFISCNVCNTLTVLCILQCSIHFQCENSCISLKKIFKKYPEQKKPFQVELLGENFSSPSGTIGQIVYRKYGSFIQKWTGEISSITDNFGCIYCVVDFTNGYQGVFSIHFTKSALKAVSEISTLKSHFSIRDRVEFDAEYCESIMVNRCWKATKIKAINNSKMSYDESLIDKLKCNSEQQKKYCVNDCCFDVFCTNKNFKHNACNDIFEEINSEVRKNGNNLHSGLNMNNFASSPTNHSVCFSIENKYEVDKSLSKSSLKEYVSNLIVLDYAFMFGYIFMLMEDKGMVVSEQGNELYNISFMMDSVYPPNEVKSYPVQGQKVLVFIPYLEEVESVSVATLVYSLSESEIKEIENRCISPKQFVMEIFLPNTYKGLTYKISSNCCNNLNHLFIYQPKECAIHKNFKAQLFEIYNFIQSQYKVKYNGRLMQFLNIICKTNSSDGNICDTIFNLIKKKMSKNLCTKYVHQNKQFNYKKKFKKSESLSESCSENNIQFQKSFSAVSNIIQKSSMSDANLTVKDSALDSSNDSYSSLSSYKSCGSANSTETFYSCDSSHNIKRSESLPNLESKNLLFEGKVYDKEQVIPLIKISNGESTFLSKDVHDDCELETNFKCEPNKMNKAKYLCLQSVPFLKHTFYRRRKRITIPSNIFVCNNCYKHSVRITAYISLISKSFFFYTMNIEGYNVVLPLSKKIFSQNILKNFKVNSCSEIIVIPNTLAHLSHILAINVEYCNK